MGIKAVVRGSPKGPVDQPVVQCIIKLSHFGCKGFFLGDFNIFWVKFKAFLVVRDIFVMFLIFLRRIIISQCCIEQKYVIRPFIYVTANGERR